jgi:hypothetical protein
MVGYAAYLNYMLEPSAKKLQCDIDRAPWSFPVTKVANLDAARRTQATQLSTRNGDPKGRKRALLKFSEITDAFVEGAVRRTNIIFLATLP